MQLQRISRSSQGRRLKYDGIPGGKTSMKMGLKKPHYVLGETASIWSSWAEVARHVMQGPVTISRSWSFTFCIMKNQQITFSMLVIRPDVHLK